MAWMVTVRVEFVENKALVGFDKELVRHFESNSFGEAFGTATEFMFEVQHKPFGYMWDSRCPHREYSAIDVRFTDLDA